MAKKDVGVIIQFDDVDYTDEERDLLWGQFFMLLAETAQEVKEKKNDRGNKKQKKHQKI